MKSILTILLVTSSLLAHAQIAKLVKGNLKDLKEESSLNIELTFDGMTIGDDGLSEADYLKRKKEELNEKEPGRGDIWVLDWVSDRKGRFLPKFSELLDKYGNLKLKEDSKYTLILHTTRTEPGWAGYGLVRKNARIDADVFIVETANRDNVVAQLRVVNAGGFGGMGYDYDTSLRIQEAYAKAGKEIGRLIAAK